MKLNSKELKFLEQLKYLSRQEIRDLIDGYTDIDVLLDPDDLERFKEIYDLGDFLTLTAKSDLSLIVTTSYNGESDSVEEEDLYLKKGESISIDLDSETEKTLSGQTGDGSVLYNLKKADFIIKKES